MSKTALIAESLFEKLSDFCNKVADHRKPLRIEILLKDFLISGVAIFSLKIPSLLRFEKEMKDKKKFSHLEVIFGINRVPSGTHMRTVVDKTKLLVLDC